MGEPAQQSLRATVAEYIQEYLVGEFKKMHLISPLSHVGAVYLKIG